MTTLLVIVCGFAAWLVLALVVGVVVGRMGALNERDMPPYRPYLRGLLSAERFATEESAKRKARASVREMSDEREARQNCRPHPAPVDVERTREAK